MVLLDVMAGSRPQKKFGGFTKKALLLKKSFISQFTIHVIRCFVFTSFP